jgi:chitodextrinase
MSAGAFLDAGAVRALDPKQVYWYKVVGVDQAGNQTPLDKAVPVSTFTFSSGKAARPVVTSVTAASPPACALVVRWSPAFDAAKHLGFAVYRAAGGKSAYLQVGSLVTGQSEYTDADVVRGTSYSYKVVELDADGKLSPLSDARSAVVP